MIDRHDKETAERHLNNAIAAIYANVGPSAPLVDIRIAMRILGMQEVAQQWEHWFSASEELPAKWAT
jgi:hypothetical protein